MEMSWEQTKPLYQEVVRKLNLDAESVEEGSKILKDIIDLRIIPDTHKTGPGVWIVCALFIVGSEQRLQTMDGNTSRGAGVKLTSLLQAAGILVEEFLDHLRLLTQRMELSDTLSQTAAHLKQQFMVTSSVYAKYRQLWSQRERLGCGKEVTVPSGSLLDDDPQTQHIFSFGWYLYVNCKNQFKQMDMVSSFHLMLACLEFVIRHARTGKFSTEAVAVKTSPSEDWSDEKEMELAEEAGCALAMLATHAVPPPPVPRSNPPSSRGSAAKHASPSTRSKSRATRNMESMEEDAIEALSMMGSRRYGLGDSPSQKSDSKVKQDVLEKDAARVQNYVRELVKDEVLITVSEGGSEGEKGVVAELAGVLHPRCIQANLTSLRNEYELKAMTSVDVLDERFVLSMNQAEPSVNTPMKAPSSRPVALTPRTSGRQLFQEYGELNSQPPYFSPAITTHDSSAHSRICSSPLSSVLTPQKQTHGRSAGLCTPVKSISGTSHYQSPMVQTPVAAAMDTLQWVNGLEGLPEQPSERLQEYANACQPNPMPEIEARVTSLLEKIAWSSSESTGPSGGSGSKKDNASGQHEDQVMRTRRLGQALYYHVFTTMLDKETKRLHTKNHTGLFTQDVFHRALLASCLEVVLKANSLVTLGFPKILELFQIEAFDFFKVLEPFMRSLTSLPYLLRQHIHDLEDQVLERIAWGSQSSIFRMIKEQQEAGAWPLPSLRDKAETRPLLPKPGHNNANNANAGSGQPPPVGGSLQTAHGAHQSSRTVTKRPSMSLEYFFRKLLVLGAHRIQHVSCQLQITSEVIDMIWTVFKHCMSEHVDMIRDRHLDQVVLCCIYGVCKVNKLTPEVTFKRIIESYRHLHSSIPVVVVRDINLGEGRRGDVIRFYNDIFLPQVKSYLIQFQRSTEHHMVQSPQLDDAPNPNGAPCSPPPRRPRSNSLTNVPSAASCAPPPSPVISSIPVPSPIKSPQRIQSSNVYLKTAASPARQQSMLPLHMTPRTRTLYAFGESPAKDLDQINRSVNAKRSVPHSSSPPPSTSWSSSHTPFTYQTGVIPGRSQKKLRMSP